MTDHHPQCTCETCNAMRNHTEPRGGFHGSSMRSEYELKSQCCATCRYSRTLSSYADRTCVRHAPIGIQRHKYDVTCEMAEWPGVKDDFWCGDYVRGTPCGTYPRLMEDET